MACRATCDAIRLSTRAPPSCTLAASSTGTSRETSTASRLPTRHRCAPVARPLFRRRADAGAGANLPDEGGLLQLRVPVLGTIFLEQHHQRFRIAVPRAGDRRRQEWRG